MLNLILGVSGSGKTTTLYDRIKKSVDNGENAILIVPEQFSFESEKALYRFLGAKGASSVQVLGFTRLCNIIFREFGGLYTNYIDDTGKLLLMSLSLWELRDSLDFYGKHVGNASFVESLVGAISEFKSCGLEPDKISDTAKNTEEPKLREKLTELSTIYATYKAIMDKSYSDTDDDITNACKKLEGSDFFNEYTVFVDGFIAFTACEYRMLEHIISGAKEVYTTFCCDGLFDDMLGLGVFSPSKQAANRLVAIAKKYDVKVSSPIVLSSPHRFKASGFLEMEAQFMRDKTLKVLSDTSGIEIISALNPYDEITYIASEIARLVQEDGYYYKDIAVIGRSMERYNAPIEKIFDRYDIPYFMDRTDDVLTKPLVTLILSALEAVRMNFETEQILRFAKNPLLGFSIDEVSMLENYAYVWSIKSIMWTLPFENNPRGFEEVFSEHDKENVILINDVRERAVAPLIKLKKSCDKADGKAFAGAVFELLTDLEIPKHIEEFAQSLDDDEKKRFLDENETLWDALVNTLEVFGKILSGVGFSLSRLNELLRLSLSGIEVGKIPQTLDQVIIGTADRIRPNEPKVTFVIGAVDGEFPKSITSNGVFTDKEREALINAGLELADDIEKKSVFEKFFAYFAVTTSSDKLTVTYPMTDLSGGELLPSSIISQLAVMTGGVKSTYKLRKSELMRNNKTALDAYATVINEDNSLRATLYKHLLNTHYKAILDAMSIASIKGEQKINSTIISKELFGTSMKLSPSKVEKFYSCPFAYFCDSGLKLKTRRKAEFSPIEAGKAIHLVLEYMLKKHGAKTLSDMPERDMRKEISEVLQGYLRERTENIDKLPARFQYLFTRLVNTLLKLIKQLADELSQCDFVPYAFEMPIAEGGEVKPIEFNCEDISIRVEGIVDRVDVMKKNNITYVRVIDYKSGSKTFKLSDIYYGLNMQMLLYLFSIAKNGKGELLDSTPAGALYVPAKNIIISSGRDMSDDELSKEYKKKLRMNGIILGDKEVVLGMEHDGKGIYIPAKLKDGENFDVSSSIVTAGEMGVLKAKIEKNITDMASLLIGGQISSIPVNSSTYNPCSYCEYLAVCGFEEGDKVKTITDVTINDFAVEEVDA